GRTWGLQIIRKHRLAERLLVDILNLDWKTAHLEACQLEHGLSDLVIGQIEKILGEKAIVCPHGSPIPSAAGKVVSMSYKKLSSISKPCKVIIKQVRCGNLDLLEKLGNFQLYPETKIIIGTIDPKKGLFKVHSNQSNQTILISFSEASDIFIELLN
ncbi:MAG: iron dependent repressor, metal binding and dimerization domain protein, partial [Candidatus Hodarchaeota archaeon]